MTDQNPPDQGASGAAAAPGRRLDAKRWFDIRQWYDDSLLRRIFRNAGTLMGGKAIAGLLALAMLAVTARGLGLEAFGALVLIHTYVKLIGGLTKFQSWQAVIRYGARGLEAGRREDVQGLIKFTALLDLTSAVAGMAIAVLLAPLAASWFGWGADAVPLAMAYSVMILFTIKATPVGVLRLFDRFDLLAAQAVVAPAVGLAGACLAWAMGGGLAAFLVVWFAAAAADGVSLVVLGWRELARQGLLRGMNLSLRGLAGPHPGLWRFVWSANLYTSLSAASSHLVTLLVGWLLGPAAAGLFKVASQFASVLVVPGTLLKRTIYPELAKLAARGGAATVRRVMLRAGALAGSVAVLAVVLLALLGEPLLRLTVGEAYGGAYGVLVVIAAANAVAIYGVALDPVFFAIGRPGVMLRVSALTTALNVGLLVAFAAEYGLIGVGLAALASTAIGVGILTTLALGRLAKLAPGDLQVPAVAANKGV